MPIISLRSPCSEGNELSSAALYGWRGARNSCSAGADSTIRPAYMIAMALALEPQVVIMDEPTTALDVVTQRQILEQVMELRNQLGFSVLFITQIGRAHV